VVAQAAGAAPAAAAAAATIHFGGSAAHQSRQHAIYEGLWRRAVQSNSSYVEFCCVCGRVVWFRCVCLGLVQNQPEFVRSDSLV
jgi:hypothetical protein